MNKIILMLRELNKLPVLTKILVSSCLTVLALIHELLRAYLRLEASRITEIMQLIPHLPDQTRVIQLIKLGVDQGGYIYWMLNLLTVSIVVSLVLLLCMWLPKKTEGCATTSYNQKENGAQG